jgi:hypothetical protein
MEGDRPGGAIEANALGNSSPRGMSASAHSLEETQRSLRSIASMRANGQEGNIESPRGPISARTGS